MAYTVVEAALARVFLPPNVLKLNHLTYPVVCATRWYARALVQEPELLPYDEPASGLIRNSPWVDDLVLK